MACVYWFSEIVKKMDRAQNLLFLIVQIEIYWFQGLKAMERGTLGTFSASAARGLHFKLGSWNSSEALSIKYVCTCRQTSSSVASTS